MKAVFSILRNASWFSLGIAVASILLFGSVVVHAATTINTDISTGGTLTVTGQSTLAQASSTMLSAHTAYFGATASSSFTSAGVLTLENGETITNATNNTVEVGATTLKLVGTASTSAITVGDEPATPTINGIVFGHCSFATVASFSATTTRYADCTTVPALALTTSDRVFVQATSSFDEGFIITAASSTGVSTINLRIFNLGFPSADTSLGNTSINFWAVR